MGPGHVRCRVPGHVGARCASDVASADRRRVAAACSAVLVHSDASAQALLSRPCAECGKYQVTPAACFATKVAERRPAWLFIPSLQLVRTRFRVARGAGTVQNMCV